MDSILTWCSIFERLEQVGYKPEVDFFGRSGIRESRESVFDTSKPLTDKGWPSRMRYADSVLILDVLEWDRIWPEWLETMSSLRLRRLERTVYKSRRRSLVSRYNSYVTSPSPNTPPNTPSVDLLPHVADVARFSPFRDIIRAPEETQVDDELFEPAFAQLPELVDEWRKKLDAEFAELVQIPSDLSLKDVSGGQVIASNGTPSLKPSQESAHKLHLACALFSGERNGIFTYPEVLSTSMGFHKYPSRGAESDSERAGSVWDRFRIKYVEEAPYIVHLCGLDPNVATAEDMDRRNPQFRCLSSRCSGSTSTWNWRDAVRLPLAERSDLSR